LKIKNKNTVIWLVTGLILIGALAYAFYASPFVNATGSFAGFEKARAIPAGLIGICGTLLVLVWGWFLLISRKSGKKDEQSGPEK